MSDIQTIEKQKQGEKKTAKDVRVQPIIRNPVEQYKYIHFTLNGISYSGKTRVWACRNNKTKFQIGVVMWNTGWRQYCFYPSTITQTIFSNGCLKDIADFLNQKNEAHKKARR